MPYIAKENIGEYKKGDTVPDEKAQVWSQMYAESPVELVNSKISEQSSEKPHRTATPVKRASKKKPSFSSFKRRLRKINGIGDKTVDDILILYPSVEALKKGIERNILPFHDHISRLLVKHFG